MKIDHSSCHPKAGVWAVLNIGDQTLRVECARCRKEVQTFALGPPSCSCGDPDCKEAKTLPRCASGHECDGGMYLHCARNVFHTGNVVTTESPEVLVKCAECDGKPSRFPLAQETIQ